MAKDYFQDILPPKGEGPKRRLATRAEDEKVATLIPIRPAPPAPGSLAETYEPAEVATPGRSIRNISMPARTRQRPMSDMREAPPPPAWRAPRSEFSRWWLWLAAGAAVVVLGTLLLVAFRSTTVTVTPRSHTLSFDQSPPFIAYSTATAAPGTLSYTMQTADFEDSEAVQSQGMVHAADKASGAVTVYNNYQSTPFKLIKNTRFVYSGGLIFRTPADIVIPGKKGTAPGQVTVTVVADQAGEQYNVAAGRFTVPGLQSSSAQYAGIYAQSSTAMTGGFVGDKPGVAAGAKEIALATVRMRLEGKALAAAPQTIDTIVFPGLIQIAYQDLPDTAEAGGGVRIHEKAHITIPVFSASVFASAVSDDIAGAPVTLVPGAGFAARLTNASTTIGTGPLQFVVTGSAQIVWKVDAQEFAQALAGKQESAFQAIVTQFPSIREAKARIEPFWKSTFPTDAAAIKIVVETPKS